MEGNTMTATIVHLPDGTEMSGSDVVCNNCDSSVAGHSCVAGSGSAPAVVYSRSGKGSTRKKADEKPPCAHCGAPMHFNYGATETNAKCMMTQYALDTGLISDPLHQKAPVLTAEMVVDLAEWIKNLKSPLTYGSMLSAAGGAGTYAALRPKTGRRTKTAPAAPGAQIQDIAEEVEVPVEPTATVEEEQPAPKKGRSRKASKPATLSVVTQTPSGELEEILATLGVPEELGTVIGDSIQSGETPTTPLAPSPATAEERAARRKARKALLSRV
jgi:hypothetical protein